MEKDPDAPARSGDDAPPSSAPHPEAPHPEAPHPEAPHPGAPRVGDGGGSSIVIVFIVVVGLLIVVPIQACSEGARTSAERFTVGLHRRDADAVKQLSMEPLSTAVLRCLQGTCEGASARAVQATLAAERVESTSNVGLSSDYCIEWLARRGNDATRLYLQVHKADSDRWLVKGFCTDRVDCPACDVP